MTISGMDLCLNISAAPPATASSQNNAREDAILGAVRGLKGQKSKGKVVKSAPSISGPRTAVAGNQRVKQKSLATIVARQIKDSTANSRVKNAQRAKAKSVSFSIPKDDAGKSRDSKLTSVKSTSPAAEATTQSSKQSLGPTNVGTGETMISFTKPAKRNVGKTLVAKKRNISETTEKRSLSDVFSKNAPAAVASTNLLPSKESRQVVPTKGSQAGEIEPPRLSTRDAVLKSGAREHRDRSDRTRKSNADEIEPPKLSTRDGELKSGAREHRDRPDRRRKSNADGGKSSHPQQRSTGIMSSLFGHNPEVRDIGQRFVKPINETVFTGSDFADLKIHPFMISNLEQNLEITKMTTVQQKAIPQIFSGKDVLIRSQTGSGKTLTYALPIVEFLQKITPKLNRSSGLQALVVVPTRELALQTYECFLKLVKPFTWIVPGYLTGGEKRKAEKARLRKGCNILVGTPGRLLDHIKHTAALRLHGVKYFVLDEADRMLDMGYEKDISGIVSAMRVSTPDSNTGYDAMQMLRQNVKTVFTDEDVDQIEEPAKNQTIEEEEPKVAEEEEDSEADEDEKPDYHSSSDDDSGTAEPYIRTKKFVKNKEPVCSPKDSTSPAKETTIETEDPKASDGPKRQTILLSATLTHAVEKLAGLTMVRPVFVDAAKENLENVGGDMSEVNEDLVVPQSVVQTYIVTPPKLRMVTLSAYIAGKCQGSGQHKVVIFMATQDMVDYHTDILSTVLTKPTDDEDEDSDALVEVEFFKLHGNMSQKERTEVFKTFRLARSGVLLCTDVAARGLDMPKVDCVIQYTGPLSARDYVHRIGRTARAGSSGSATIFLTPPEIEFVRMLESRRIRIKQESMDDTLDRLIGPLSRHRNAQTAAIALQNDFENLVLEQKSLREKAYKAYTSWVRFYTSYPRDMREIFNRRDLNLGHYAKSFALRDTPGKIGGMGKTLSEKDTGKRVHNNRLTNKPSEAQPQRKTKPEEKRMGVDTLKMKKVRMLNTSEYDSGLEPLKKRKKSQVSL